ncbi:MAG: type III-B CRISPR module RAMP protein Cmr1 [Anaerolineae bacterium]|nr:type III-B CRISPR module RAMP protein Cmr1 [Anaerolineae bacterium]
MRELKVTLETVTPLFLGGADQEPELRPPSVRGQLRYWLRAAIGGVIGDQNLDDLKKAESEVFGDTKGQGAIGVHISQKDLPTDRVNPLPHKESRTRFEGFLANQRFDLILAQQQNIQSSWLAAIGALLLMSAWGGLGRRSRRGWGTLRILQANTQEAHLNENWMQIMQMCPNSVESWQVYLSLVYGATLSASRSLCKMLKIPRQVATQPTAFPILRTQPLGWLSNKIYAQPEDAIREFGEHEHNFGVTKAFGSADRPRWASPLWVRVFPVKHPKPGYILGLTLLESQSSIANYERLHKFINSWNDFVEVTQ